MHHDKRTDTILTKEKEPPALSWAWLSIYIFDISDEFIEDISVTIRKNH